MSEKAELRPIGNLLEACWPGEWGTESVGDQSNCVVYRATDIDDEGHLRIEGGAERNVLPTKLFAKSLRLNDILLEASGGAPDRPVGRVALVSGPTRKAALTSNFFRLMRPKSSVDARFLTLQLVALNRSSAIWRYQQQTTGLINLKVADYLRHAIWAPKLDTQRKVADVLGCIDTAIEKTKALIAKHQQIKAGLMHDLFTRGVLPNGQLRPPRSEAPELYQETAIGWIPKDWQVSTLRQCLTDSPTNGIYKPAEQIGEGQLMVGQTAFTEHRSIDFSLCRRGAVDTNEARRYGLAKDDILVTRVFATVEGVGLPTLVPQLIEPAVFESNMMRLRIDANIVIARLLFEWLQAPIVRNRITGGANASNQCSVNQGILNPLPVVVPIMAEQRQITARVVQADMQREVLVGNLTKLRQQKLGLMQDLLTGKVAVKVDGQTSATADQAIEQKVLSRMGERAQAMEVDIDAI